MAYIFLFPLHITAKASTFPCRQVRVRISSSPMGNFTAWRGQGRVNIQDIYEGQMQ